MPRTRRALLGAVAIPVVGLAGCSYGHTDPGAVRICGLVAGNRDDRTWRLDVELLDGNRLVFESTATLGHGSPSDDDRSASFTDEVSGFRGSLVLRARLSDREWRELDLAEAASGDPGIDVVLDVDEAGELSIRYSTSCHD